MKVTCMFMVMSALVLGGFQSSVRADDDDDDRREEYEEWLEDRRERAEKDRQRWYKHRGRLSEDQREWLEDERERREEWLEERRERYEDWLEDERERREEWWKDDRRHSHWRPHYDYGGRAYRSPFYSPPRAHYGPSPYDNRHRHRPSGFWFRW